MAWVLELSCCAGCPQPWLYLEWARPALQPSCFLQQAECPVLPFLPPPALIMALPLPPLPGRAGPGASAAASLCSAPVADSGWGAHSRMDPSPGWAPSAAQLTSGPMLARCVHSSGNQGLPYAALHLPHFASLVASHCPPGCRAAQGGLAPPCRLAPDPGCVWLQLDSLTLGA